MQWRLPPAILSLPPLVQRPRSSLEGANQAGWREAPYIRRGCARGCQGGGCPAPPYSEGSEDAVACIDIEMLERILGES